MRSKISWSLRQRQSGKFESLVQFQKEDPDLGPIVQYLQNPNIDVSKRVKNVAKNYVWNSCLLRDNRICVPIVLKGHILRELHTSPTAGHLGRQKTLKRVLKHFYWPGVGRDVRNYVRACRTCQLIKPVYLKPPGYMQAITSEGPWDFLAADLVGPLPESNSGHRFVLVVRDHFTKWVFA